MTKQDKEIMSGESISVVIPFEGPYNFMKNYHNSTTYIEKALSAAGYDNPRDRGFGRITLKGSHWYSTSPNYSADTLKEAFDVKKEDLVITLIPESPIDAWRH